MGNDAGMRGTDISAKTLWVLRNARMHADDPALRTASGFAQAAGVHRSQVGRWENGSVEVTFELVRRYEEVLGLPERQLACAIDVFGRRILPAQPVSATMRRDPPDVDATLVLLEKTFTNERMTGLEWDQLSRELERMPHALIRHSDWEQLVRRCNAEIGINTDLDFALRQGAAIRFVRHPRSANVVTQLAEDILKDPGAQVYADIAAVLRYTTHPAAMEVLMGQLREPTNDHALRAGLLALTSLIAGRRLSHEQMIEATRLALGYLRDQRRPFRVRRGAANLIRAVQLPSRARIAAGLTGDNQAFAASIIMAGRARGVDELRELEERVRKTLDATLSQRDQNDPVLKGLLEAAISVTNEEENGAAMSILMLSPQGRLLGRMYTQELVRSLERNDHVAAHECLGVLSWVMQPEELDVMTEYACSPDLPGDFVYESAVAVAHAYEELGPERDAREDRLLLSLEHRITGAIPSRLPESAIRGLTYSLGMRGRMDIIDSISAALSTGALVPSTPEIGVRTKHILGWWQSLPDHIRPLRQNPRRWVSQA